MSVVSGGIGLESPVPVTGRKQRLWRWLSVTVGRVPFPMDRITGRKAQDAVRSLVEHNSLVMTDEARCYHALDMGYRHESVMHSKGEYVRGTVHTNTVEGFFSLLKRGINGVYHHVGKGHLGRYCDEFSFRYSTRKISDGNRATLAVQGAEGSGWPTSSQ